ncbi:MAG: CPBP family intramembrane metalloprotease [Methanosphaera sp.]|nr:CPBP family intramembrane metalloprotease [Methanosphaera sp.]
MYKYTDNHKVSIIVSMIIVMIFFALLHLTDMKSLVSVLVLQGFGSIFEFYGYVKTKNLLAPYITHLCTDMFIFILVLSGL